MAASSARGSTTSHQSWVFSAGSGSGRVPASRPRRRHSSWNVSTSRPPGADAPARSSASVRASGWLKHTSNVRKPSAASRRAFSRASIVLPVPAGPRSRLGADRAACRACGSAPWSAGRRGVRLPRPRAEGAASTPWSARGTRRSAPAGGRERTSPPPITKPEVVRALDRLPRAFRRRKVRLIDHQLERCVGSKSDRVRRSVHAHVGEGDSMAHADVVGGSGPVGEGGELATEGVLAVLGLGERRRLDPVLTRPPSPLPVAPDWSAFVSTTSSPSSRMDDQQVRFAVARGVSPSAFEIHRTFGYRRYAGDGNASRSESKTRSRRTSHVGIVLASRARTPASFCWCVQL